jgi:serine/threonine-protein kinase RsbW
MDKQDKIIKLLKLQNKLEELETINVFLDKLAGEWEMPFSLTITLNLVIEEAFTNVVKYAYADDRLHNIEISFEKEFNDLKIKIIDDGEPYDPTQNSDPDLTLPADERSIGGLGIYMIRKMMDKVEYQRTENKNVLIMTKGLGG